MGLVATEPPWIFWRLELLRGWSEGEARDIEAIFA